MMYLVAAVLLAAQSLPRPIIQQAPILPDDTKPAYRALSSPECRHWRAAREGKDEDSKLRLGIYRMWVQGYVTGFNVVGPDQTGDLLGGGAQEELFTAVDGYCTRNLTSFVDDAMRPIATAYLRRRASPGIGSASAPLKRQSQILAAVSCGAWDQGRNNAILRLAYATGISGYLTAYNRWGPDPSGDAVPDDRSIIEGGLDRWCEQHPRGLLIGAVQPLLDYVAAERTAGRLPRGGKRNKDRSAQSGETRD